MPPPAKPSPPSPWPPKYKIPFEVQQRLDALLGPWRDQYGEHSDTPYEDAFKEALAAYMETPQGKKLKDLLLSNHVLPLTLTVVGMAVAGTIANDGDIPSPPGKDFGGVNVKVDFLGKFDAPKGVFITLSVPLGSGPKPKHVPRRVGTPLPTNLHAQINRQIDKDLLRKWIVKQAAWEYETAGPDEEAKKKRFYHYVKNRSGEVTPDAQLVAEALAREFVTASKQRLTRIDFHMGYAEIWDQLYDLSGLTERLRTLARTLAGLMPKEAAGVQSVAFYCGKRVIPVLLK
jgi:hypothetical protein